MLRVSSTVTNVTAGTDDGSGRRLGSGLWRHALFDLPSELVTQVDGAVSGYLTDAADAATAATFFQVSLVSGGVTVPSRRQRMALRACADCATTRSRLSFVVPWRRARLVVGNRGRQFVQLVCRRRRCVVPMHPSSRYERIRSAVSLKNASCVASKIVFVHRGLQAFQFGASTPPQAPPGPNAQSRASPG